MKYIHSNWRLSDEIYLPVSIWDQQNIAWLGSVTYIEIGGSMIKCIPDVIHLFTQGAGIVDLF